MKNVYFYGVVFLSLFVSSLGLSSTKDYFYRRYEMRQHAGELTLRHAEGDTFQQLVNHGDAKDVRTFAQRYYVDSQYADGAHSPVLFYLCGEAVCDGSEIEYGEIVKHAQSLRAHLVALEHRYYGKSQPFDTLTTDNLKYLTVANALADAARFESALRAKNGWDGKWIVVGGSYAGSLSAYYRQKYPHLVVGSLASSGPVKAQENFEEFDRHVTEVAGSECAPLIRKVSATVEAALRNPTELARLRHLFQADALTEPLDFLYLVADMGALAIQYGYRDPFCTMLKSADPLSSYAQFTRQIFQEWGMTALEDSAAGAVSLDPKKYENGIGIRQWFYQSCAEYGYWQNAYHDPKFSVRSRLINMDYHRNICRRLFGIQTPVDAERTNRTFYRPLFAAGTTNILFTNGSRDPWSQLSITKLHENEGSSNPGANPGLTLFVIDGAAHCDDLRPARNDSDALTRAKARFEELAADWLK